MNLLPLKPKLFVMVFAYDFDSLNASLKRILQKNMSPAAWQWLEQAGRAVREGGDIQSFNIAFVAMPRRTGKQVVDLAEEEARELDRLRPGLTVRGWSIDRLARVWLLLQPDASDTERYASVIENLFLSAEMSELVALYSALPLLPYPERWRKRCAEGIRSNIGQVLEAIICNNPYPAEHLDESAWNQLVLKAIFTEKPVLEIAGLKKRANRALAASLSDYAHERWAAGRPVNPLLWICVGPFIDSGNFSDIQRVFQSPDKAEREAAALAAMESSHAPARAMVASDPDLKNDIERGRASWQGVAMAGRQTVTGR